MTGLQSNDDAGDFRNSARFREECEARYYLSQYHRIEAIEGKKEAQDWWSKTVQRLRDRRGPDAVERLRDLMNRKTWNAPSRQKRPESR